ncbi:MAG: hypothetical protein OEQ75_11380 [Gemmatimonadota bacterium]|nr:hypothetical protein [Gemmatimonadota bacterium]
MELNVYLGRRLSPKLDQRIAAARLLLEYSYGKPHTQRPEDGRVDPEELKAAAVDDVLAQLERFARVTQLARVPVGSHSEDASPEGNAGEG